MPEDRPITPQIGIDDESSTPVLERAEGGSTSKVLVLREWAKAAENDLRNEITTVNKDWEKWVMAQTEENQAASSEGTFVGQDETGKPYTRIVMVSLGSVGGHFEFKNVLLIDPIPDGYTGIKIEAVRLGGRIKLGEVKQMQEVGDGDAIY